MSGGALIVNDTTHSMADQIKQTLNKSTDIRFLVGYFYFSGFAEIYKNIGTRNMKILVGLDVDVDIYNVVREYEKAYTPYTAYKSKDDIRNDYYKHLAELFKTDIFDSPKREEAFKVFCKKIFDGTLEIRKTQDPNHSKLYLFEAEDPTDTTLPGHMIIGSSNLSESGLRAQDELNVIFHNDDYLVGKELFDKLWKKATPIADLSLAEEFKNKVLNKIWIDKIPSPYLMYLRVLQEYFADNIPEGSIKTPHAINEMFSDLAYQTDAIKSALVKIKRHNGVIIADVVGLGKSILGACVAANLGLPVVIICPPHLQNQWNDYCSDFGIKHISHIYSNGKIKDALDDFGESDKQLLIIIDEAHKYRNDATDDYANLKMLCNGNKVVLLTATPYNNRPKDLKNLICLFQKPGQSTLKNVENLGNSFDVLISDYKNVYKNVKNNNKLDAIATEKLDQIAKRIQNLISPITIRRSRKDLINIKRYKEDLERQHMSFSKVKDPQTLEYQLGELSKLYIDTLNIIYPESMDKHSEDDEDMDKISPNTYKAARYKALMYVKPECRDKVIKKLKDEGYDDSDLEFIMKVSQRQLAKFIRRLLVQRFESSIAAFGKSLESLIANSKNILSWMETRNTVPIYKKGNLPDIEEIIASTYDNLLGPDEALETAIQELKNKGLFELDCSFIKEEFKQDIQTDLQILQQIQLNWFGEQNIIQSDPKVEAFTEVIKDQLSKDPERKIVIFSGYADTAEYVANHLKKHGLSVFYYSSLVSSTVNRKTIISNFDAGLPSNKQENNYKILVATDAISEGYNLHRAGTIFNYDIPYNPTRVIQRVGRINRINKKVFDELYIYNFFPTAIGAQNVNIQQIANLKMRMINAIMGNDTKILDEKEVLKQFRNEMDSNDKISWETPYFDDWIEAQHTPELKEALQINPRTRIKRESHDNSVIVFGKQGDECVFKKADISSKKTEIVLPEDALPLFKASKEEVSTKTSAIFEELYQLIKENLFINMKGTHSAKQGKALARVNAWKNMPENKDFTEYLDLLIKAIEVDDIPNYKFIDKSKTVQEVMNKIPLRYLIKTVEGINSINSEPSNLILSEEL